MLYIKSLPVKKRYLFLEKEWLHKIPFLTKKMLSSIDTLFLSTNIKPELVKAFRVSQCNWIFSSIRRR